MFFAKLIWCTLPKPRWQTKVCKRHEIQNPKTNNQVEESAARFHHRSYAYITCQAMACHDMALQKVHETRMFCAMCISFVCKRLLCTVCCVCVLCAVYTSNLFFANRFILKTKASNKNQPSFSFGVYFSFASRSSCLVFILFFIFNYFMQIISLWFFMLELLLSTF